MSVVDETITIRVDPWVPEEEILEIPLLAILGIAAAAGIAGVAAYIISR